MTDHHSSETPAVLSRGPWRLAAVLAQRRRSLIVYPLATAVLVVAVSFLFPNVYRSQVTILPPERDFQSMTDMLSGIPNMFATEMVLPFMATPSDILAVVLQSQTVRDSITTQLNLDQRWDLTPVRASARLFKTLEVNVKPTGIVEASVRGTERWFNDSLINAVVAAADRVNQAIANSKARRTREFVERRLAETEDDLRRAANTLEAFQNKHRTVALDEEIAALAAYFGELQPE